MILQRLVPRVVSTRQRSLTTNILHQNRVHGHAFSTSTGRKAQEDSSPMMAIIAASPTLSKLTSNPQALLAFRELLDTLKDEGIVVCPHCQGWIFAQINTTGFDVGEFKPTPIEMFKLAANPRVREATNKFKSDCKAAGFDDSEFSKQVSV